MPLICWTITEHVAISLTDHTDSKLLQLHKLYVNSHTVKWGTCKAPNPCLLQANIFRAGGASPVAQAMAGPIFETFQDFSSGHVLVQAGNMRACRMQAKCRRCQTIKCNIVRP